MKLFAWKSNEKHVPLEDEGDGDEDVPHVMEIDSKEQCGNEEAVEVSSRSAAAASRGRMKLVLKVILAGLAIAALALGAYAALDRKEDDTPNVVTSSAVFGDSALRQTGDFNDGVIKGAEVAEQIWADNGSDCSNIWTYDDDVDTYIDANFPDDGNWQTEAYNRGVRAGAQQVIDKYEKQCLDDSPDECNDLGVAAAQEIAFEYCPFDVASSFTEPDYKEKCREVATGVCEGKVGDQVSQNGCSITTSDLLKLQNKCEGKVDSMTGVTSAPSSKPIGRPTKKPTRKPRSTPDPTFSPTLYPTLYPTQNPTFSPTLNPTIETDTRRPTRRPSRRPTRRPTRRPRRPPTPPTPVFPRPPADGGVGVVVNVGGDGNAVSVNLDISTRRDDFESLSALSDESLSMAFNSNDAPSIFIETNSNDSPSLFFEYTVDESNATLTVDKPSEEPYEYEYEYYYYEEPEAGVLVNDSGQGNKINVDFGN